MALYEWKCPVCTVVKEETHLLMTCNTCTILRKELLDNVEEKLKDERLVRADAQLMMTYF